MAAPVKAKPGQFSGAGLPPSDTSDQGSYPAEVTRDQVEWLQQRAADHRKRWADHAATLACNQKS